MITAARPRHSWRRISITVPPDFTRNARRFLYYQLYKTSLPFDDLLEEDGVWPGYVRFKELDRRRFRSAQLGRPAHDRGRNFEWQANFVGGIDHLLICPLLSPKGEKGAEGDERG